MIVGKECKLKISSRHFGNLGSDEIYEYSLSNGQIEVKIINYGCIIRSIEMQDRNGSKRNIVAGFDNLNQYLEEHPFFGSVVGRYANRISGGRFSIGCEEYNLPLNDGPNHLHGGHNGFHKKVWKIETYDRASLTLSYISPDGEEGYPGNLNVTITYILTANNQLIIRYRAVTDKPTIVNLTNHSYFNLSGFETSTIYDHLLKIDANSYTEKNGNNIPNGQIHCVNYTPYDFLEFKAIGKDIYSMAGDMGYDMNYVLNVPASQPFPAAELYEPVYGRLLKVFTDRPGLQIYTANWWDGKLTGSHEKPYLKHGAIALETQAFPDSPNHTHFPCTILNPGEVYETETIFQFLTG